MEFQTHTQAGGHGTERVTNKQQKQPPELLPGLMRTVLRHCDVEGAARNVLLSPLHSQDIIALLLDDIRDAVLLTAHMLHGHLFAGRGGAMDADQQHVGTWEAEEGGWEPEETHHLLPVELLQ